MTETVSVDEWVARATALRTDGYTFCDVLMAQDETSGDDVRTRVTLRVRRDGTWESATIATDVADALPSLQGVYPGVAWHEREAAEMFGLTLLAFHGGEVDARPLLLGTSVSLAMRTPSAPLRKAAWLSARQETRWPGEAEPGRNRRRQRPIGVPDDRATDRFDRDGRAR